MSLVYSLLFPIGIDKYKPKMKFQLLKSNFLEVPVGGSLRVNKTMTVCNNLQKSNENYTLRKGAFELEQ